MASSFMGLYVQREALNAAQKALDITGNNISNVKTQGYSRQRVDVCSVANTGYNLLYNTGKSLAGQGTEIVGVAQYRDALKDEKVRNYTTLDNDYNIKDIVMKDVETALDNIESKEYGFAANLAKFKEALQGFSSDEANRKELANIVFREAESVTQQIRYMNSRLDDIAKQTKGDANIAVDRVNTILSNMASLNKQISDSYVQMEYIGMTAENYEVNNLYGPLELKDQMNLLIDELSSFGNVMVKEEQNGSFTVSFAGQIVVHNDEYAQMSMVQEDPDPLYMGFKITAAGEYIEKTDSYSGLMNARFWKQLATDKGLTTREYVLRNSDAVVITDKQLLTGGTLRGYLDVYNGEGSFSGNVNTEFDKALLGYPNEANDIIKQIYDLGQGNPIDSEEMANLLSKLQTYGKTEYDEANGIVKFCGKNAAVFKDVTVDGIDLKAGYAQVAYSEDSYVDDSAIINELIVGNAANPPIKGLAAELAAYRADTTNEANKKAVVDSIQKLEKYGDVVYNSDTGEVTFNGQMIIDKDGNVIDNAGNASTTPVAPAMDTLAEGKLSIMISKIKPDTDWGTDADAIQDKVRDDADSTDLSNLKFKDYPSGSKFLEALVAVNVAPAHQEKYANGFQGIEYYRDMLNSFVSTMTREFNNIYKDFTNDTLEPLELFTYSNTDGKDTFRTAAANFDVTDTWRKLPSLLAQPEQYVKGTEDEMDELNNDFIHKCLAIFENSDLEYYDETTGRRDPLKMNLENFVAHISDTLGTQIDSNAKILGTTDIMLEGVVDDRDEVMGVSINEEGINMMNFQKWYNAIARMTTTLDEALDKIINGMGIVGR